MKSLSRDAHKITGQPMFGLLAKANELEAQGRRILHFEMGEPYFNSPPDVITAACDALHNGKTHYANSMGTSELRDAVCDFTKKELGYRPTRQQVLITPANAIIYFLIRCVVNHGEEVIYPDPGFPTYYATINFAGAKGIPVPLKEENKFRMSNIGQHIKKKTKLLIINSPNNPTGSVMTKEEIEETASIAEEADIYLLTDETYAKMTYDATHYSPSLRDQCRKRTILLNTFSKAYSMTGWRLGYAIGPEEVIEKMGLLLQTTISCVSPFIQHAGVTALSNKRVGEYNQWMVGVLRQRRDQIILGLNSLLGVSCLTPEAAFYAFPNITGTGLTSQQFADLMLEKAGVALLPGTNFGKHGEGYVRLSYATDKETIEEAIERMRLVIEELKI